MAESVLTLKFRTTECNGWGKFRILIDDDLYEDYHCTQEDALVSIPLTYLEGEHILSIEIYGKTDKNTLVDETGNIIQDQLIELIEMTVDNVQLPKMLLWHGTYTFNETILKQALIWGCNGTWEWKFKIPFITWVLDKKVELDEAVNPSSMSHIDMRNEIIRRYNMLEVLLNDIDE